jgi:hypothetical protein
MATKVEKELTKEEIQQLVRLGHQPGRIICSATGKSEAAAVACRYVIDGVAAIDKAGMHQQEGERENMLYLWCENCSKDHLVIVCLPALRGNFPVCSKRLKRAGHPRR